MVKYQIIKEIFGGTALKTRRKKTIKKVKCLHIEMCTDDDFKFPFKERIVEITDGADVSAEFQNILNQINEAMANTEKEYVKRFLVMCKTQVVLGHRFGNTNISVSGGNWDFDIKEVEVRKRMEEKISIEF
ncbi:MAG: hypothetical protein ACRCRT_04170 [Cetobacterium somerae]